MSCRNKCTSICMQFQHSEMPNEPLMIFPTLAGDHANRFSVQSRISGYISHATTQKIVEKKVNSYKENIVKPPSSPSLLCQSYCFLLLFPHSCSSISWPLPQETFHESAMAAYTIIIPSTKTKSFLIMTGGEWRDYSYIPLADVRIYV